MPGDVYALLVETAGRHAKSFHMCIILKDPTLKSTVAFSMNVEACHDTGATSTKQQHCAHLKARPERLLEYLLVRGPQTLAQKQRWLTVSCLRPILVGLLSQGRTFECDQLLPHFFRHAASQEVF